VVARHNYTIGGGGQVVLGASLTVLPSEVGWKDTVTATANSVRAGVRGRALTGERLYVCRRRPLLCASTRCPAAMSTTATCWSMRCDPRRAAPRRAAPGSPL
jgi:hypothetical protein